MKYLLKLAAAVAGLVSTAAIATPVYNYSIDNPAGSSNAGDITNVTTSYDDDNSLFTWEATTMDINGQFADGFWLVVSDGPNPKADGGEYAAMCGDLITGRLNVFTYNGQNNNSSCSGGGSLLQSQNFGFIDVIDNGNMRTFSFSLDVSAINSAFNTADWDGVFFDDTIGLWFHTTINSNFTYNDADVLTGYTFGAQSWYDTSNQTTTTPVPTPAPLLLMALALPMLLRRKK